MPEILGDWDPVEAAGARLQDFALRLVDDRRAAALDPRDDLVSGLIAAEVDGRPLTDDEIVQVLRLLIVAGHNSSGNRDPEVFDDADECVIDRRPNPHLVFGRGIHACIGRGLAEMELRVAIEEVLARTRWLSLAGPVERTSWVRFGGELTSRQLPRSGRLTDRSISH